MKSTIKSIYSLSALFCLALATTGCLKETMPAWVSTETEPSTPLVISPARTVLFTDTPTAIPILANIQPAKYSLDIEGAERLLKAAQKGLYFRVVGIYAINNKIAFLFGSFTSLTGDDIRSALFHTEDGGQHWLEVLPSFTSSEISHVLFVQNGQGWASIGWTSEGLQGTTFWHTSDYGKVWEEIPNVNTGRADVLGIRFFDSLHGQRILFDGTGNPNRDGLVIEVTSDGGYTWEESLRVHTSGIQQPEKLIATYADIDGGRYGSHWGTCKWNISNGCRAFGEDGGEWNVKYSESNRFYIVTSQSLDVDEASIYKLPVDFRYQDGELIYP